MCEHIPCAATASTYLYRARLESLCSGLLAQTVREVQQFLEAAALSCADVHKVFN